jgi:hypothetical protein
VSILNVFLYAAALISGLRTGSLKGTLLQTAKFSLWLLPLLGVAAMLTTKATVIFGVAFWGAGRMAGITLRGAERSVSIIRLTAILSSACAAGFAFVVFSQLVRWGSLEFDQVQDKLPHFAGTLSGHMSVFGQWLDGGGASRPAYSGGAYTFAGVAEMSGVKSRAMGLYEEVIVFENGYSSNIYTAFRALIEDFGLAGALVFFASVGLMGGFCWVRLLAGSLGAAAIYVVYASYIFISPITSVFTYNTNIAALVMFSCLLGLIAAQSRDRDRVEAAVAAL